MTIFIQSSAGFRWIWSYSSNPRRVFGENGHIRPILGGFSVNMAIFVPSSAGVRWILPYSSNPRQVFGEYGHIRLILVGFSIDMTIFIPFPPGFVRIHTNFNSYSSRFAWCWSYPSNPCRVSGATIQILMVSHWGEVGRKDIHPKTCQVSDSSNK